MADKTEIDFQLAAVKEAFLKKQFLISTDPIYDYYQTNSGMYAKNPLPSGGGGGDLDGRVAALEDEMDAVNEEQDVQNSSISEIQGRQNRQSKAAQESANMLSSIKTGAALDEIDDIVDNQLILSASQDHLYKSI